MEHAEGPLPSEQNKPGSEIPKPKIPDFNISQYQQVKQLGSGHEAYVYLYKNEQGDEVAIKEARVPIRGNSRLEDEARVLMQLHEDPRAKELIVGFKGAGINPRSGAFFIAEEALTAEKGWTELFKLEGKLLAGREKALILRKIMQTMKLAQDKGIIQEDVKNLSFFIKREGAEPSVRWIDLHLSEYAGKDSEKWQAVRKSLAEIASEILKETSRDVLLDFSQAGAIEKFEKDAEVRMEFRGLLTSITKGDDFDFLAERLNMIGKTIKLTPKEDVLKNGINASESTWKELFSQWADNKKFVGFRSNEAFKRGVYVLRNGLISSDPVHFLKQAVKTMDRDGGFLGSELAYEIIDRPELKEVIMERRRLGWSDSDMAETLLDCSSLEEFKSRYFKKPR